jgi:hypothetical protein
MKMLLLVVFLSFFGNSPSNYGISYRPLSWSDFRAPVPYNIPEVGALTATQLVFEEKMIGDRYYFKATAYFEPDSSYVRIRSEASLRHEQTHFKIAFLLAQECMRELGPLQGGDTAADQKANALYEYYLQATEHLNIQFDRETNHCLNPIAEKQWEIRISQQLNAITHGRNR